MNPIAMLLAALFAVGVPGQVVARNVRTSVHGDIILSYASIQNNQVTNLDGESFRIDQADLGLHHRLNDIALAYVRLAITPGSVTPSEAYLKLEGLPWNGAVTLGKFYRPLGASIPLSNLSFPQLMVHAYPEIGVKATLLGDPVGFEVGVTNGYALAPAATSARVAGTAVLANANTVGMFPDVDNNRNWYGRIALNRGEDWGSLTLGMTYLAGRLPAQEVDALNPGGRFDFGLFRTADLQDNRQHLSYDLDYQYGPWRLFGEFVEARDGRLRRDIYSAAGSYTFYPRCGMITTTIGWDKLDIKDQVPRIQQTMSWDRQRTSFTVSWWPEEMIQVQAEYDWNYESITQTGGGKLENDAFTLQSVFYF